MFTMFRIKKDFEEIIEGMGIYCIAQVEKLKICGIKEKDQLCISCLLNVIEIVEPIIVNFLKILNSMKIAIKMNQKKLKEK